MPIAGVPRTRRAAVGELDVVDGRLELVRGDGDDALAEHGRGLAHRARRHRPAAAAGRTRAEAGDGRVALDRVDVLDASRPSASAVSCTTVVSRLLPVEPPAMYTLTAPDGSMRIVAASVPYEPKPGVDGST